MRKKSILITGVGGDIGQSIIKCLKETNYNINLMGCDIDPYAAGRTLVTRFFLVPRVDCEDEYYKSISEIINKRKVKYIFPSTEAEIEFFDKNRSKFDKKNIKIFINNHFILGTFFDKYKTIIFLKKNNIPCPETFLIDRYSNQLNYPIIIKPRRGCGGREFVKISNGRELNFYKHIVRHGIVQESVGEEREEYTTGVFSNGQEIYSITFRRKLGLGNLSKIVELVIEYEMSHLAERIARAVNLIGSINIQTRKTEKGFVVFEINPRFSSTVYFRHHFGFKDVKWWLDMVDGKDEIEFKLRYKNGVGVRNLNEVFFDLG